MGIIDKNKGILDSLHKINQRQNAKSIETFHFSTLYTMIKHTTLIENLDWFVDKAFNGALGKGRSYMAIYSYEAKWITKPKSSNTLTFDKTSFKDNIHFLIENAYFELGNRIIKQTIGIPMGTDRAPFMANVHLHKYEFDKIRTKKNYKLA